MTDISTTPEAPNVAETVHFLRRFADLMQVGHNANYLHHAAVWLETLAGRLTAALDEEKLWRYKYETITQHTDALEAECGALKHDIDGHLITVSTTLSERDALSAALQAREAELIKLRGDLDLERAERATIAETHERAQAALRATFDRERETLAATVERRDEEMEQLRRELAERSKAHELELSQVRLGFAGERHDFAARLKVSGDELAALRLVSERERDALIARIAALETKRAELRSTFDRIGHLKDQTNGPREDAGRSLAAPLAPVAEARPGPTPVTDRNPAVGEADVVVPKATLRQVRSQFEFFANEFTGAGDVASQVMCELGAFTMDVALGAERKKAPLPVSDVALSILTSPGSVAPVSADRA